VASGVTSSRRFCVSRKNTEATAIVMERDALISPATSSVLGLRAGITPLLCAGSFSYAQESVETIPFTINLNLSLAMQLPRGLETAFAETTAPLFPVLAQADRHPDARWPRSGSLRHHDGKAWSSSHFVPLTA